MFGCHRATYIQVQQPRPDALRFVQSLCRDAFEKGVRYFFPDAVLSPRAEAAAFQPALTLHPADGGLDLEWMGVNYRQERTARPLSSDERRMMAAVGAVISARYQSIVSAEPVAKLHLLEGLPEDRYVSAFLDPVGSGDVLAQAIGVLRQSSLITYESRRISTGVILVNDDLDAGRRAVPYDAALMSIKRFHRLCDGLRTVFLVNAAGMLVDLVDVERYAKSCGSAVLPAPGPERYRAHSLATAGGGNVCLVLSPNGEIKIFAGGVQALHFLEGRWHITDLLEKYARFHEAVGDSAIAERLFVVALNLAEARRGALFIVLDEGASAAGMVAPEDLLDDHKPNHATRAHYLLRDRTVVELEPTILQSIAGVDGGIVLDRRGRLLAFGAILRTNGASLAALEGGRSTAAMYASRFGLALKVSEDGFVSFYRSGVRVWEI